MNRDKFQKIKNLYERGATEGERQAAAAAMDRLRLKYGATPPPSTPRPASPPPPARPRAKRKAKPEEPKVEQFRKHYFKIANHWDRALFVVLCEIHGLEVIHEKGQRTTVTARAQRIFVDKTLWPQYLQLKRDKALHETLKRIIRERVVKP